MTTSAKSRGLGRGLGTLLSNVPFDITALAKTPEIGAALLPLEKLQPGKYQPRKFLSQENLQELAESIRAQGVIQPIIVRPVSQNRYEIIAGERRWRASQLAGLKEVPVVVRDVPDNAAIAMALIENIQREDLNVIEEAQALKRLQDEFKLTQQQVSEAVGKSRVSITHTLRLLDLHPDVQKYLHSGKMDRGHAKTLMGLAITEQARAANIIVTKVMSVREAEKLVQQWYKGTPAATPKKMPDPNIGSLERKLSDKLGTPVIIQHNKKGRGKLVIHYRNLDALDGILGRLK
ncbi:MAG: ParB/RepB/Spo0J family partition protein [Gammaproteobacteria bacterium]|nr:ParB/RepB/Spo0J family partition protein [Gammaproteobacteria bacterium]